MKEALVTSYTEGMRIENLSDVGPRDSARFLLCDISSGRWKAIRWLDKRPKECEHGQMILYFSKTMTSNQ